MGFCSNYGADEPSAFIMSCRKHVDADIVLLTANMKADFHQLAKVQEISVENVAHYLRTGFHPLCARFFMYRDYLARHPLDYASVLLSDIRDVVFQADPFLVERDAEVYLAAEDAVIASDRKWNSRWLLEIYGADVLREIELQTISCAGTTLGSFEGICKYLQIMAEHLLSKIPDRAINYDQGVHNYIAWEVKPDFLKVDLEDTVVSTVIKTHPSRMSIEPDGVYIDGLKPAVLHQWDRHEVLSSFIADQYGSQSNGFAGP